MTLFIEQPSVQWEKVKAFYEAHYKDPVNHKKPFRFGKKPSDEEVLKLYKKMLTLKDELNYYYQDLPHLKGRLQNSRNKPQLIEKRGPFE